MKIIISRQKKKVLGIWLLCIFCFFVLGGCDSQGVETQNNEETVVLEVQKDNPTENLEISDSEIEGATVELTEKELAEWTDYVNNPENNAFLLSYYNEPKQIDLNELFYTGCGLDMVELSEKEIQEYLEWTGMDEIYTGFTRITGEQIASVLKQRLGVTMEEMEKPLEWCYLRDSDAYVMQHGDTNAQNFNCIAGSRTGNQVILEYLLVTGEIGRVTLELPQNSKIWMFVSNEMVGNELTQENSSEKNENIIFISDEAYMEVDSHLGAENAQQLCVFAENYEQWLPEEGEVAGGTLGIAVYDLDQDGQLELMCTLVQGTGIYACNSFYHADVESGRVFELEQKALPTELAFEIDGTINAYQEENGRILYRACDYEKAGLQSAFCTEGYYYLENEKIVSVAVRSYMLESNEEEEIYTYYLTDWDSPVEEEEWKKAEQNFLTNKEAVDVSICWKNLYETEIREKKALDWFLLLAESLDGAANSGAYVELELSDSN